MAVIASDGFNRADGALGAGWITDPSGSVTISGNKATSGSWEARALRDIGITHGYRVQVVMNAREWPNLLMRWIDGWAGGYRLSWSNPDMELRRRVDGTDIVLQTGPAPGTTNLLVWAEVREVAGGTEITWGHGTTMVGTYTDDTAGRPAGTKVGFQSHPGKTFDDFLVETVETTTTTTSTTTEAPTTTSTTTTTTTVPPLPTDLEAGVTYGHLSHHARLHAIAGVTPAEPGEGDLDHLHHHAQLKAWYDPAHEVPLVEVTDAQSHVEAHEALHIWVNEPSAVTTTTTTGSGGGSGLIEAGATSLLYPNYLNSGSVMQRDVSAMPLAANSAELAAYVRQQQINTGYYTSMSTFKYNFPSYAVAASEVPPVNVRWKNNRQWDWTPQDVMDAAFGPRPVPAYAVPAAGTDAALVVYDIESDTMWEWWQAEWISGELWAEWGSATWNANNNYPNQSDVGSLSASGMNGVLGQIGIGEVRDGWIDHALIYAIPAPGQGVSWPAKQSDGWSTDPNAPKETQWARLPPAFDVETLDNALLKMVATAAKTYGIALVDQAGAVAFCAESGSHEQATTGTNPWTQLLATAGGGKADWEVMQGFPWESTQWAPTDWGKP